MANSNVKTAGASAAKGRSDFFLDIDAVLDGPTEPGVQGRFEIGNSRDGRPVAGFALGDGERAVSLIAGCHADEPVGPAMLDRFTAWLQGLDRDHPLLTGWRWRLVPHANPDGESRNAAWTDTLGPVAEWARPASPVAVDLLHYLRHVVREKPGDDLEFGFPRREDDADARPEARAIAAFLRPAAPFRLHGSFHGMAFAAGPWFLIEEAWAGRTRRLRDDLRRTVDAVGYTVHDIDRGGEKGFTRIDRGFTTRPDSRAMVAHFEARGDCDTAALFRPSSMEFVRALGGDPFTFVSEMPLFTLPADAFPQDRPVHVPATAALRRAAMAGRRELAHTIDKVGARAMPVRDQMAFQLHFLDAALRAVDAQEPAVR